MKAKKYLVFLIKMMFSGILALIILSLLCLVYYNPPLALPQPDGYTNYKFPLNTSWSFMTEGNGRGTTNSLGYNDLQDPVAGEKAICFLGSSHTEALQVDTEKNFVSVFETMLASDESVANDYQCLNLGISGHFFNVVVSNFQSFANNFDQVDYVIIETSNVEFSEEELEKMLNEEYHNGLTERSFIYESLRRVPYLRLLFKQYGDLQQNSNADAALPVEQKSYENYAELLDPVMNKLSEISREHGFELIILHHSYIYFDENNQVYAQCNAEAQTQFQQSCEANGIRYLNTNDIFCKHVNSNAELPYGFSNTCFGTGHLNEVGHQLVAELLYSEMFAKEEG